MSRSSTTSSLSRRLASLDHSSMWNNIPPQHSICPSSLTSRACLSQRRRLSTFSLAASVHGAPPNKWLIWQGDRSCELCLCTLFSLMRSASLLTALGIPRFVGPSPKEEATRRSIHTRTHDANGYQATSSDRCCL